MANPSSSDLEVASIFFGLFFGVFIFTAMKVLRQTWSIWKRAHRLINVYVWMIWIELIVNFVFALTTYLFVHGIISPSFGYFFGAVTLWALQTQLLIQIIANRVGLIMVDKRKSRIIKWSLFVAIGFINVSVFCIWVPALMEVSDTFVRLNLIWERVEKGLFLVIDFGLNFYFLYHVRSKLIMKGLTKYWPLFNFNVMAVFLSVSMDALLLGMLSLPNQYDYVQFAPVAYTIKLSIELTMAELISKVVRSAHRVDNHHSSSNQVTSEGTQLASHHQKPKTPMPSSHHSYFPGSISKSADNANTSEGSNDGYVTTPENDQHKGEGIMKTVTVLMNTSNGENHDEVREDSASATAILRRPSD